MKRLDIKNKNSDVLYRVYYIEPHFEELRLVSDVFGNSVDTLHISKESIRGLIQTNHDLLLMNLHPKWNTESPKIKSFETVKNIQPIYAVGMGYDIDFRKKLNSIINKGTSYTLSTIYKNDEEEFKVFDSFDYTTLKDFKLDTTRYQYLHIFSSDIIIEKPLRLENILIKQTIINKVVYYFKKLLK